MSILEIGGDYPEKYGEPVTNLKPYPTKPIVVAFDLQVFYDKPMDSFYTISVFAMAILLGWGVGNVVVGSWRQFHPSAKKRNFWLMNAGWGLVNSVIALVTLYGLAQSPESFSDDLFFQQQQITIILINCILDCAYIAIGYSLLRMKRFKHKDKLRMFGYAIIIQGGFLLAFDLILFTLLAQAVN